jgi:SAM-dependent methyltransferase
MRWPVLVEFTRSILSEDEIANDHATDQANAERPSGLKHKLLSLMFPPNAVAEKNIDRMLDILKETSANPVVLVVGGGTIGSGIDRLYHEPSVGVIGFDVFPSPMTQFIADGHQIPLRDASVDAVVVQAVLEHVLDPWQVVAEIHRVLKRDGLVYADTPFMQQVHLGPYDFTRFTESGHRYLFKKFEMIDSGVSGGSGTQLSWTIDYTGRGLFRSTFMGTLLKAAMFWVRYLDKIAPAAFQVDNASGVFFLGRRSEREIAPKEMVTYYKGAQRQFLPKHVTHFE